jgi:uncharacterized protein YecE (DUF72 family)
MTNIRDSAFYSGTSNVELPVPNKAAFPPAFQDKSRLAYYGSLFNSVEINSSFYKLPLPKTVARWVSEVPAGFKFTFKLWQQITHTKGSAFNPEHVERFMQVVNAAGTAGGCILVQFPPSVVFSPAMLSSLLTHINLFNNFNQWHIAVEFRHRSWYRDITYDLLNQHKAAIVYQDLPASAAPLQPLDAAVVYLRFHGPNGGYRGSYDDEFLYEYAGYVHEWLADGKMVFAYFNNTAGGAVQNLIMFNRFVAQQAA